LYLLVIIIASLLFLLWLFRRDRKYMSKQTRDIVSDDMKRILNIPTSEDQFSNDVEASISQKKPSKEILKSFNDFEDH